MSALSLRRVPALGPRCALTVAIPARDEEPLLEATLRALIEQRSAAGGSLQNGLFDVIVFANNCRDATAPVARAFAARNPAIPISVLSGELPTGYANVGMARKLVMDLAASRFIRADRPRGVVATTDADTIVDERWVASILHEMTSVDAVAGHVTIAEPELATLLAPVRLLYSRERAYRRAFAEAGAVLDPLSYDPVPRHASFVGASFAVAAETYFAAGGLPPIPVLEDRTFFEALCRIDARVRHSMLVRAATSARRAARVEGGFGSFVAELYDRGLSGESFCVENPRATLEDIELRGILRTIWAGRADASDLDAAARILGVAPPKWLPLVDSADSFGLAYEAVRACAKNRAYEAVPVEVATAVLGAAVAERNAPSATRMRAASGAG